MLLPLDDEFSFKCHSYLTCTTICFCDFNFRFRLLNIFNLFYLDNGSVDCSARADKKRRSIDQTFVNWWKLSASASAIVCVDDVAREKKKTASDSQFVCNT